MGARSLIQHPAVSVPEQPPKVFHAGRRSGKTTDAEQALVTQFLADQKREITEAQVGSLARLMRRSMDAIRTMIERARENFQTHGEFYVAAHKQAVEAALTAEDRFGNPNSHALDAAMRGSQWAMENLSAEGVRIVEPLKAATGPTGPRILVGIQIGGLKEKDQESTETLSALASTSASITEIIEETERGTPPPGKSYE